MSTYTLQDRTIHVNGKPALTVGIYRDESKGFGISPADADGLIRKIVELLDASGYDAEAVTKAIRAEVRGKK